MWLLWIVYLFASMAWKCIKIVTSRPKCREWCSPASKRWHMSSQKRCEDNNRLRISPGQVIIAISFGETQMIMNKIMQSLKRLTFGLLYLLRNSPSKTAQLTEWWRPEVCMWSQVISIVSDADLKLNRFSRLLKHAGTVEHAHKEYFLLPGTSAQ